ncbi:MAG: hypothetical protein K2Q18_00305 [Bdellovibrionales bacterium]|nr:hypothetical protein [Bdellovibrionales bacterium]
MKARIIFLSLLLSQSLIAAENVVVKNNLFVLEKTYNPQNTLQIHALTDQNCKFVANENGYIDYYWHMNVNDSKKYFTKPVDWMIRSSVDKRLKYLGINSARDSYKIKLTDLTELNHDLEDTTAEITSQIQQGQCISKAVLKLGPSGKYRKMRISKIHCAVTKSLIGLPDGCSKLTVSGSDADTNEKLKDMVYTGK